MCPILVIFRLVNGKTVFMRTTKAKADEILDNITDPKYEDVISIYLFSRGIAYG